MLIAAVLLTIAGCSLVGRAAVPSEPLGDFVVGEFGGIDGRQNILHVRTDGVALLVSRAPAAGKLSDQTMSRLQSLLMSSSSRREVARDAKRKERAPVPVCADQITTEVTMGNLSMSRSDPCQEESEPTPAFDEILSLVAPALDGNFDGPVDSTEPRLFPLRLERIQAHDQPAYTITVRFRRARHDHGVGRTSELHALSVSERDTLRLLLARVIEKPVAACTVPASYRLHVEKEAPVDGADCAFPERQPEFHALAAMLENDFGV